MKIIYQNLFSLFLIVLCFGCVPTNLIHKNYVPAPPTPFIFENKKEIKGAANLANHKLNLQIGWAFSENFAVVGSGLYDPNLRLFNREKETKGEIYLTDFGLTYFKKFEYCYLSLESGFGRGVIQRELTLSTGYGTSFYQDVNIKYWKYYLQPSCFLEINNWDFGLILKYNFTNFYRYKYDVRNYLDDVSFSANDNLPKFNTAILEPVLHFKWKWSEFSPLKINLQLGAILSKKVLTGDALTTGGKPLYERHPEHIPFYFNLGISYNLRTIEDDSKLEWY